MFFVSNRILLLTRFALSFGYLFKPKASRLVFSFSVWSSMQFRILVQEIKFRV